MEVFRDKDEMRRWSRAKKKQGMTVALVPTMGFLHSGHLSLVQQARELADVVVVSIYINPSQFAPTEDFNSYPRDIQGDLLKLQPYGVTAVFNPHDLYIRDLYDIGNGLLGAVASGDVDDVRGVNAKTHPATQGHETWVRVERLELPLCGRSRPGFFRGVATVVTKLFHIVEPDVAMFGKKDYQQWRLISRMVRDLDFPVKIVGCELLREEDGLAMSSRNVHLTPAQRVQALSISQSLMRAKAAVLNGTVDAVSLVEMVKQEITNASGRVDYVEMCEQESLDPIKAINGPPAVLCVAAWFGHVRLIDNMELQLPQLQ